MSIVKGPLNKANIDCSSYGKWACMWGSEDGMVDSKTSAWP